MGGAGGHVKMDDMDRLVEDQKDEEIDDDLAHLKVQGQRRQKDNDALAAFKAEKKANRKAGADKQKVQFETKEKKKFPTLSSLMTVKRKSDQGAAEEEDEASEDKRQK